MMGVLEEWLNPSFLLDDKAILFVVSCLGSRKHELKQELDIRQAHIQLTQVAL